VKGRKTRAYVQKKGGTVELAAGEIGGGYDRLTGSTVGESNETAGS